MPRESAPASLPGPRAQRTAIRPAVWAAVPWTCGIAIGFAWDVPLAVTIVSLGGSLGLAALLRWRRSYRTAFLCLLLAVGALGLSRAQIWRLSQPDAARLAPLLNGRVVVVGTVSTDPQISGRRWCFGVEADTISGDSLAAIGRIPLYVRTDTALGALRIGERVRLTGTMRPLRHPTTPGLFDYGAYLARRSYVATLAVHSEGSLTILVGGRSAWVRLWDAARDYVRRTITVGLPSDEAGLMRGLVLGDRSGLSWKTLDEFQACGIVHILSVSGLHVGIIVVGVGWPLRRLFRRRKWHVPVLVLCAWSYAALTGGDPPVVRASIMATVFLLGMLVERKSDGWNALALSALVTLLISPQALFEIGFQLSYAAMAGILWMSGPLGISFDRVRFLRAIRAGRFVGGLIVMTIAAQVVAWPFVAHYFHRVPVVGAVSNPPVVALVTLAVWGAMVGLLVGWWPAAVELLNVLVSWLLRGVFWTTERTASWPGAALWVRPPGWIEIGLYTAVLWIGWSIYRRRGPLTATIAGALLLANLWVWSAYFHRRTGLELTFLDVGQGDAIVCSTPGGATMLIDGGPANPWFDAGDWVVIPYLRSQGIERVDVAIATHADNDHIGGLASVLDRIEVGELWYNGRTDTSESFRRLMGTATRRGVPVRSVGAGDSAVGLKDVRMLVLSPPRDSVALVWWPDNDLSVVLRVEAYGRSALLTGDAGFVAESRLIDVRDGRLKADALKVAHHGSAYSTSDTLLALVRPRWSVVSVGASNSYGHPSPSLLERLDRRGVSVFRTDRLGTVRWHVAPDTSYWRAAVQPE